MAFHGGFLPNLAVATTDLWPSISNSLAMPWRGPTNTLSRRTGTSSSATAKPTEAPPEAAGSNTTSQLPDFLRSETPPSLSPTMAAGVVAPSRIQSTISMMGRHGLHASNPILRRPIFQTQTASSAPFIRLFMRSSSPTATSSRHLSTSLQQLSRPSIHSTTRQRNFQMRGFGTASRVSRNQLATAEESANRNPGNANAQNAFYQLLLKANMPAILVERYQSGRFTTNAGTDDAYRNALAMLSGGAHTPQSPSVFSSSPASYGIPSAVAQPGGMAQSGGYPLSGASMLTGNGSRGGKGEPVYVVIDQSMASTLFRWVKFFAWFLLFTYISLGAMTVIIEFIVGLRRGTMAKNDAEVSPEKQTTRFSDVHGCDEAKEELQEVVEFLRNPERFTELGAKLPKGVLLVGPPGTGKTLIARAVAGEAGTSFFYMSGSEFDEIYVGVGAKRVRDLFTAAKAKSPAIVFIDELDAVGGKRSPKDQAHAKQTLNQLLTELDGFDKDTQIVIIGATNLPDSLDKALTRPGRFDRHIHIDLPEYRGRLAILEHHAKKLKLGPDINLESVASRSAGKSGAELENLLNIAALRASRFKAKAVDSQHMEWAFDRITMGAEKRSRVITEEDKELTAYREAGHALIQLLDKDNPSNLYKVTILAKGPSLGHTAFLPAVDKTSYTATEYLAMIRTSLGGKMAEELIYGNKKTTTGVSSDLQQATHLAFSMLTMYGMSDTLGPVEYYGRYEGLSSETKAVIEKEVQTKLKGLYEDVRKVLTDNRKQLDLLAKALVEYETLNRAEVEKVIRGETLAGRPRARALPSGPIALPLPADETDRPGLDGVPQPQPPEHSAP